MFSSQLLRFVFSICLLAQALGAVPKYSERSEVVILQDRVKQIRTKLKSAYRMNDFEAIERGFSAQAPVAGAGPTYFLCNLALYDFSQEFDSGTGGSDVWGWRSPDGDEYALMGTTGGIAIVNATRLAFITEFPIPVNAICASYWRDIKTYQNYCYVVSDCSGSPGLVILDLQFLPDSVHHVRTVPIGPPSTDNTSHNISVDTLTGFLYVEGVFANGQSIYIYDLADPGNPAFVSDFGPANVHDMHANNDTLYVAEGWTLSYSIWDVKVKINPILLTRFSIPGGDYAHMIWPTDDRRMVATTEELPVNRTVKLWNIENLPDVELVGEYIGPGLIPHNAHIRGDTMYVSHYTAGVRVVDISDPTSPTEIGFFDTHPASDDATFEGNWGVYPYVSGGLIYASDMKGLLFILLEMETEFGDTLSFQNGFGTPGSVAVVEVHATTQMPVRQFIIPFEWPGPFNMTLDSASTVGTRTENFERVDLISIDPFNKRAAYLIAASRTDLMSYAEAGSGPILKIYFSMPSDVTGETNPIRIISHSGQSPSFTTACLTIVSPDLVDGEFVFGCCLNAGDVNNDQRVNISDVTFLIGRIFGGGPAPKCADEADANGDNSVNVADVTYLIARIFAGGSEPQCGNQGF